jgi:hypothetical protein
MCPPALQAPTVSTRWLQVDVHLQDNHQACGRACAQMVLLFLTHKLYQQTRLIPKGDRSWGTSPDQLCELINTRLQPPEKFVQYKVFAETNRKDALDRIWRGLQIKYPSVSLCVPELKSEHWVVVRGITDGTPATAHFRNPMPARIEKVHPPLPKHTRRDCCRHWDLMNDTHWYGEFVSVCSSLYLLGQVPADQSADEYPGCYVVVAPDLPADGETPEYRCEVPPHDDLSVSQLARKRLEETGLLELPEWGDFVRAPLVEDEVVVSVNGLTDPGEAFDLVQVTNKAGNVALVRLSKGGEFMGAMLEPSTELTKTQFEKFHLMMQALKSEPGVEFRTVWSYTSKLFFSPFVFAMEVRVSGAYPRRYYVRPYDQAKFESLSEVEDQVP